jgi:hypothetical protein
VVTDQTRPGLTGGHVFISYSHGADAGYVRRLASYLRDAGLTVWFDHEIVSGDRWARVIRERIDSCAAFIVVMTPQADASRWVGREIAHAETLNKPVLPLLLEGRPFFSLSDVQYESVVGGVMPSAAFLGRLRTVVRQPGPLRTRPPATVPADLLPTTTPSTTRPVSIGRILSVAGAAVALLLVTTVGILAVVNGGLSLSGNTSAPPLTASTTTLPAQVTTPPTTQSTPPATQGPPPVPTTTTRAPFPVPDLAGFAHSWPDVATECDPVSTNPQQGYTGLNNGDYTNAVLAAGCKIAPPFADHGYVAFVKFKTPAAAKEAMYCGDGTTPINGIGAPPPGIQGVQVDRGGDIGRTAGWYCEHAQDAVSESGPGGKVVEIVIAISWTDATLPFAGRFEVGYNVPSGSTSYTPPSDAWTKLRAYWLAHA